MTHNPPRSMNARTHSLEERAAIFMVGLAAVWEAGWVVLALAAYEEERPVLLSLVPEGWRWALRRLPTGPGPARAAG
jgi:hypothetical protein